MSWKQSGRWCAALLLGLAASVMLTAARAQNLDAGKPAPKLFADNCATCHRSPRGLAKGRFSLTLQWFLRDHYVSGPDSAKALAEYLVSVDSAPGGKPRAGTKSKPKPKPSAAAPRPSEGVPAR
jgi:mono/diheme cytochrome c family protein